VEADIAGPLNESGTGRGRLLGAADTREATLDRYFKEPYVGCGALDAARPLLGRPSAEGDDGRDERLDRLAALVQRLAPDRDHAAVRT
jgi:hypothetical protein